MSIFPMFFFQLFPHNFPPLLTSKTMLCDGYSFNTDTASCRSAETSAVENIYLILKWLMLFI